MVDWQTYLIGIYTETVWYQNEQEHADNRPNLANTIQHGKTHVVHDSQHKAYVDPPGTKKQ